MTTTPTQRYEVIERLDAGGMAEVFRGRAVSIEGFEKQVAIKRVLPHLAQNQKFVNMFLDEAKLSLFLDHANVVSVFDLGRAGDTYFIVMEFIDGANLKRIIEWFHNRHDRIPIAIAVYITMEMCRGLDYAHQKQDPSGNALNIVHRDVSPPNVLVSKQGEIKLTDFGLAKAQSQIEVTDPGVVKGKFGYLSPEAAIGEAIDQRTDVFAVGIVLWEMLAGRRLFQGKTDVDTLQLVRAADIPPLRTYNPDVDPELEQIARDSLARDPARRTQTARELGTNLSKFLFSRGMSVTSYDLASYVTKAVEGHEPTEDSDQRRIMSTVIQDEINKLIRIEAKNPTQPVATVDSGPLEDPRTWGDFAFDELPPTSTSGTFYAARGADSADGRPGRIRVLTPYYNPQTHGAAPGVAAADTPTPSEPPGSPNGSRIPARPPPTEYVPRKSGESAAQRALAELRGKRILYGLGGVAAIVVAYIAYMLLSGS